MIMPLRMQTGGLQPLGLTPGGSGTAATLLVGTTTGLRTGTSVAKEQEGRS